MDGILAVGGFWLCMIAIVLKKPVMAYIEKSKTQNSEAVHLMEARVQQLESSVSALGTNMTELREATEFAQKMIIESSKRLADSHQLLIESSRKLAVSQKPLVEIVASTSTPSATAATPAASVAPLASAQMPALTPPPMPQLPNLQTNYDPDLGKVISDDTVRFDRVLPASIERVWQYLTKPEFLSAWLAVANLEQRVGGRVELHFDQDEMPERRESGGKIRGLVSCFEPQRRLAFSWIDTATHLDSAVDIELTARGEQTAISITHSRLPESRLHEVMAGWHTHLDVLVARLKNVMPPSFPKRYRELIQTYAVVATTIVIASGGPALASSNNDAYQTIQAERSHLLSRYDSIWKDADELQHRINALKRDNTDEAARALGRLDSALQEEYRDLHQIELEIRDLNRALN